MRRQLMPTSCNMTEFPFFITVQLPLLPLAMTWTSNGEDSLIKTLHILNHNSLHIFMKVSDLVIQYNYCINLCNRKLSLLAFR